MRISSYAVARPAYYDRNAASVANAYAAFGVAPHGNTTRFTYTVASGKKLYLETMLTSLVRITAPTISGNVFAEVTLAGNYVGQISFNSSTLWDQKYSQYPGPSTLYAGETLTGTTSDASTGGTISYYMASKGTLFDA